MKPFLKWAGGKGALVEQIVARFPAECKGTYWEPFLGGGAVFWRLKSGGFIKKAVLSDSIEDLMTTYKQLKKDPLGVISWLRSLEDVYFNDPQKGYYLVRDGLEQLTPVQKAARTIFLNRTCFNGLFRQNQKGEFNVPIGRYKNPTICNEKLLRECSAGLKNTKLACADFESVTKHAEPGDWVYFDPPYYTDRDSFTDYTGKGFGREEHERLAAHFHELRARGVFVVASNSNYKFIHKLYKGAKIHKWMAPRNISADATLRQFVIELVIVGGS